MLVDEKLSEPCDLKSLDCKTGISDAHGLDHRDLGFNIMYRPRRKGWTSIRSGYIDIGSARQGAPLGNLFFVCGRTFQGECYILLHLARSYELHRTKDSTWKVEAQLNSLKLLAKS